MGEFYISTTVTLSMSSTVATLLAVLRKPERLWRTLTGFKWGLSWQLLVGMWCSKKLLKLAQAKHRIWHMHGNDIKLAYAGAPGFPEMRDSTPTLCIRDGCSSELPFHQRSLEARILCVVRGTVTSCFLFPLRAGQAEIKWIKQHRQDLA